MAIEYAKVMKQLGTTMTVVGRSKESADLFFQATGIRPVIGGLEKWLGENKLNQFDSCIVTVGEKLLGVETIRLLKSGAAKILVEKPGAFDYSEFSELAKLVKKSNAHCIIGYNRRFYSSVRKAREMIAIDGGVTSFQFEFTEWSHKIGVLKKEEGVLEHWFYHNSSHVIDMAFFLGGAPEEIACFSGGGLAWHPSASVFYGAGKTKNGALFSYSSNWEAPGRWSVEVCTKKHRYIFKPLETLQVMEIGSVAVNPVDLGSSFDTDFKPGIFLQTKAFLEGDYSGMCTCEEQSAMNEIYKKIEKDCIGR